MSCGAKSQGCAKNRKKIVYGCMVRPSIYIYIFLMFLTLL